MIWNFQFNFQSTLSLFLHWEWKHVHFGVIGFFYQVVYLYVSHLFAVVNFTVHPPVQLGWLRTDWVIFCVCACDKFASEIIQIRNLLFRLCSGSPKPAMFPASPVGWGLSAKPWLPCSGVIWNSGAAVIILTGVPMAVPALQPMTATGFWQPSLAYFAMVMICAQQYRWVMQLEVDGNASRLCFSVDGQWIILFHGFSTQLIRCACLVLCKTCFFLHENVDGAPALVDFFLLNCWFEWFFWSYDGKPFADLGMSELLQIGCVVVLVGMFCSSFPIVFSFETGPVRPEQKNTRY